MELSTQIHRNRNSDRVLFAADMVGTLLFAIEGASAATQGNLDLFGLLVLAFVTALAGGIFRDLLIGEVPPASLRDWRYAAMAFAGGLIVFAANRLVEGIPPSMIMVLDAAGLGLFAVAGTQKALAYKMHEFVAILMGGITAVGGGVVRDIFLAQVPAVLRTDIYATAALAGSACMIVGLKLRLRPWIAALGGGLVCFLLRVISVWQHWNLPHLLNR